MIVQASKVYENVATKASLPKDLVKSIGSTVFTKLKDNMLNPDAIGYELPKFGIFHVIHPKFRAHMVGLRRKIAKYIEQDNPYVQQYIDRFEKSKKVLAIMDEFDKEKQAIQLLKDERRKSSQGQPT